MAYHYCFEWYPAAEVEAYLVKHPEDRDGNEVAVASDIVGATCEHFTTFEPAIRLAERKARLCFFGCAHVTREQTRTLADDDGPFTVWERDESFELMEITVADAKAAAIKRLPDAPADVKRDLDDMIGGRP